MIFLTLPCMDLSVLLLILFIGPITYNRMPTCSRVGVGFSWQYRSLDN